MITEITINFPESGPPELAIAGYDHGFALTMGKNSRTWRVLVSRFQRFTTFNKPLTRSTQMVIARDSR